MSYSGLPPEILKKILRYLPLPYLQRCSTVCNQWRDVTDIIFKDLCKKEYPETYEEEYRKADNLSWQEFHNSLSLWPHIKTAEMNIYHSYDVDQEMHFIALDRIRKFFVLENGIISYPQQIESGKGCRSFMRNGILYYDSKSLGVFKTRKLSLEFDQYSENDDFFVVRSNNLKIYIGITINHKMFLIGEAKQYECGDFSNFELVKNRVYFLDKSNRINVSYLVEQDGEIIVKTEPLDYLHMRCYYSIVAISSIDENHIYILTSYGHVYSIFNKETKHAGYISKSTDRFKILDKLNEYGFDWSQQAVYDWLHQRDLRSMDVAPLSKLKDAVICKHGNIVVMGTSRRVIHIYCNPYRRDGGLKLYNAKPCLKIDLNEYYLLDKHERYRKIEQIDVIEILNGHRIIVLYSHLILSIELIHRTRKRTSITDTSSGLVKKIKFD